MSFTNVIPPQFKANNSQISRFREQREGCKFKENKRRCEIGTRAVIISAILTLATNLINANQFQDTFQLVGNVNEQAHLPCLIGKQIYCGEPYFIAWYKLNGSSKSWLRLELKSSDESWRGDERFTWSRQVADSSHCHRFKSISSSNNYDCGQLTISRLELADEGQYKCEITFSESLDFDKCPASTISKLSLIAQPSEPELVVNGRAPSADQHAKPMSLKEGGQVRLECQSGGGRPAPRIEWLNVSEPAEVGVAGGQREVRLLRADWPSNKKTTGQYLTAINSPTFISSNSSSNHPISSSSVTISLSSNDLNSRFACLVIPQLHQPSKASDSAHEQLVKSASYLSSLVEQAEQNNNLMLKWIKLDVQVKPTSVRILVRDLATNQLVEATQQEQSNELNSQIQTYFSLKVNALYAIQCVVENSRPKSYVTWFNRTAPILVEQQQLINADFLMPTELESHRLTSFSRSLEHSNGTFRTVASLVLRSNIWDNFEELFCRVSNEAFQFDELIQVAPIISARLYVNYPPFAWLEIGTNSPQRDRLDIESGAALELRCFVGANPISDNAIIQFEWLKNGRKLDSKSFQIERANHLHMSNSTPGQFAESSGSHRKWQLAARSRLVASSSLTIAEVSRAEQGDYSCAFKLVPSPTNSSKLVKITSGQTKQSVKVNVIEAKAKAPTVKILSTGQLHILRLGVATPPTSKGSSTRSLVVAIAQDNADLSLKCDLPNVQQAAKQQTLDLPGAHKVMWYLNGEHLHSSASSDTYNFTLNSISPSRSHLGAISCAHHVLNLASSSSTDNFQGNLMKIYESINEIDLRLKVGAHLLERRELLPPVRSFSDLELTANPATKLKLICLAQCEPICSLDWYLNNKQLISGAPKKKQQQQQLANFELTLNEPNQTSFVSKKVHDWPLDNNPAIGNIVSLDNFVRRKNESSFSFIRHTSISFSQQQQLNELDDSISKAAQNNWSSRQLMREASILLDQSGSNVFSKLELTYNQISHLFAIQHGQEPIHIKCKLNNKPAPHFSHLLVQPNHWFPEQNEPDHYRFNLANEQLVNLTSELDNEANKLEDTNNWMLNSKKALNWHQAARAGSAPLFVDEMQISILMDKPPNGASILFAQIVSTDIEPNSLSLSETQLIELVDPNKALPVLSCQTLGNPYPIPTYKWTFTDLNSTEHSIQTDGPQLNLRQLIELKQRQLILDPMSAYGVDMVSAIVGNYSCLISNIHGSKQATLPIQVQGRPLCKLTLGAEYLSYDNELMANLRCSIYSMPMLLETVWFRNNQQLAVNKSIMDISSKSSPVTFVELPIMLLNKQQDFMLNDLVDPNANFKCIAHNSLGYSEACDLRQVDKQMLLRTFKPLGPLSAAKSPSLSMLSFPETKPVNYLSNSSVELGSVGHQVEFSLIRGLFARLDWLLVVVCSLALVWILFAVSCSFLRRRFGDPRKLRTKTNTSWRFNPARTNSNEIVGTPFQSKMCANYYGGSNEDSEHDMIQSCSQSSHYEDFAQHQIRMLNQQQQPLYFNGQLSQSTLNRRHLKSSLSASSTGDSSNTSASRHPSSNQRLINASTMRDFPSQQKSNRLAATMRESLVANNNRQLHNDPALTLTSNVPLVNGTNNSRIKLDQRHKQQYRFNRDQQTFSSHMNRNEHIYDDVIYNQMIL